MTTATDEALDFDPTRDFSSGLIDDFDGTITDAYFGTDSAYNDGQSVLLILDVATDDPDTPQITEKLSVGTGWNIVDGGAAIEHDKGKEVFNKSTRLFGFVKAAHDAGARFTLPSLRQAATYKGLGFHWLRQKVEGFNGESKEVLLPSALLAGAAAAPAAAASPSSEVVSPALVAKLKVAAKAAADWSEFIDKAYAIDGVAGNAGAEAMVTDEDTFNALRAE